MIAIVDYGAGNLTSVDLAVRRVGGGACVTSEPSLVDQAERVIFPGVGAARFAMDNLSRMGLDAAVRRAIEAGKPVLGICLGTQIIFERSDEDGGTACLGILPGRVERFPDDLGEKIPHMGWNEVEFAWGHPVMRGVEAGSEFYFVHSYFPVPSDHSLILGRTTYGSVTFAAAVARKNLVAFQFHPEKSGRPGLQILGNFLTWDGRPC